MKINILIAKIKMQNHPYWLEISLGYLMIYGSPIELSKNTKTIVEASSVTDRYG